VKTKLTENHTLALMLAIVICFSANLQAGNWWETIELKGDFRYRQEFNQETGKDDRYRHRVRARIGIYGKVSDYTKVGFRLATGSNDPTSTNQTLDDAASTKQVSIDLAYFESQHNAIPGFTLAAGKFKNPFFRPGRSELVWDSDWNPEGGALTIRRSADNFDLTLIGSGIWIEERSSEPNSFILATQAVGRFFLNEKKSSVTIGAGLFSYTNTEGYLPFYDVNSSKGDSVVEAIIDGDTLDVYATDFELLELSGEATHVINHIPVTLIADYVQNQAADSLETAWLVGVRIGQTKKPGSWAFRYNYRRIEKDAVVGAFTNSDFRGGGTDAKGHELGGSLMLANNTVFAVTYFAAETGLLTNQTTDHNRVQIDLLLKF